MVAPGRWALAAAVISASVASASPDRHGGLPGPGPVAWAGGTGVLDQAHDRVRGGRDEIDGQIWERAHPGETDHEQAATWRQQPGDAGQGVIEIQMVQHGHHRTAGSYREAAPEAVGPELAELAEGAAPDDEPVGAAL